jgi:hypothetical protein
MYPDKIVPFYGKNRSKPAGRFNGWFTQQFSYRKDQGREVHSSKLATLSYFVVSVLMILNYLLKVSFIFTSKIRGSTQGISTMRWSVGLRQPAKTELYSSHES